MRTEDVTRVDILMRIGPLGALTPVCVDFEMVMIPLLTRTLSLLLPSRAGEWMKLLNGHIHTKKRCDNNVCCTFI